MGHVTEPKARANHPLDAEPANDILPFVNIETLLLETAHVCIEKNLGHAGLNQPDREATPVSG